jgi:hypothetical protein
MAQLVPCFALKVTKVVKFQNICLPNDGVNADHIFLKRGKQPQCTMVPAQNTPTILHIMRHYHPHFRKAACISYNFVSRDKVVAM